MLCSSDIIAGPALALPPFGHIGLSGIAERDHLGLYLNSLSQYKN